jgi:L-lactate dehydrogenase
VIITAGAKRKPDQTRLELLAINESIVVGMVPEILEHSANAKIVIVSNPCDVLATRAVMKYGLQSNQVFSSGNVLDTSRLAWVLSQRLGVSVESVNAMVLGEHGDSQFPLWSHATINSVPLLEYTDQEKPITESELAKIAEEVKTAGASVIAGKGATNYGIGSSSVLIAEAIIQDQNKVLPVASVLTNYKGVSDVAISVPTVVNSIGASKALDVSMTEDETASLISSAEAVRASVESLD